MVRNPVDEEDSKTYNVELPTQLAEKELIVRIIVVGTDEVGDSLVMQQLASLAACDVVRALSNQHSSSPGPGDSPVSRGPREDVS